MTLFRYTIVPLASVVEPRSNPEGTPQAAAGALWGRYFSRPRQFNSKRYGEDVSKAVDTIIAEAVRLPPDERLTLAHRILSSVEPEESTETEAAWDEEIRKRMARYDA